jgi:hypothetical protein
MIDLLIKQLPLKAMIPIKMMRYAFCPIPKKPIKESFIELESLDIEDVNFESLRGMIYFQLFKHKHKKNVVRVLVKKLSFYDLNNKLTIKAYDNIIEGNIEAYNNNLLLKGKVIVTYKGKTHVCPAKMMIKHSHKSFYELNFMVNHLVINKIIYGVTLFEK